MFGGGVRPYSKHELTISASIPNVSFREQCPVDLQITYENIVAVGHQLRHDYKSSGEGSLISQILGDSILWRVFGGSIFQHKESICQVWQHGIFDVWIQTEHHWCRVIFPVNIAEEVVVRLHECCGAFRSGPCGQVRSAKLNAVEECRRLLTQVRQNRLKKW